MKKPTIELVSLVNAQDKPAVIIDGAYKIIAANDAYCATYGIDPKQILDHCCHEVSHHSPVPCHMNGEHCPYHEVFTRAKPFEVLHTHYDRHNRADLVRIKAYPLHDAAGRQYLLETIHRIAPPEQLSCEEMRMVGRSPAFLACLANLSVAARSDAPALIYGESGVGKELAARHIHDQSTRRDGAYLELNCAAIPEALCESELFGHERGSFTGCAGLKKGLFELADGGTLFLDEIGELPLAIQAKLLRVLDSGEFRRVGGHKLIRANVRVIAATNRNLMEMTREKLFRHDLYFRIAGIKTTLPPLRDRKDDIAPLAQALVARMCARNGGNCLLTKGAIEKLENYGFPGNIRELGNILHKALALAEDHVIRAEHIHFDEPAEDHAHGAADELHLPISEVERAHITGLLHMHNGNRRIVADILGISERTLYRKIKRYQMEPSRQTAH